MNAQRYAAYRSLVTELDEWRMAHALESEAHEDLRDAAEGLLLARAGDEAEEQLARASTTVRGMLALDELDEQNAVATACFAIAERMSSGEALDSRRSGASVA